MGRGLFTKHEFTALEDRAHSMLGSLPDLRGKESRERAVCVQTAELRSKINLSSNPALLTHPTAFSKSTTESLSFHVLIFTAGIQSFTQSPTQQ